jgi:serine/threonine protein kinase
MAKDENWERIKPLGTGGQSEVFLVRSPARVAEREKQAGMIAALSGRGLNQIDAQLLAAAVFECARGEYPSELGAMKIFSPRASGTDAEDQAHDRLRGEIKVLGQDRLGLLRLLDSSESEGWIVTEYCPLGTLEGHLRRYAGNVGLALVAFRSLVETVAGLHKDGVIHRDIKPANVFVAADGRLILGDFGIVFLPGLPERITFTNESVGPHDYIPPWAETEERVEELGPQFDVYMLGKLLWCMVAGRLKLPREWHRRQDYDLILKFPDNPQMHMVNKILDKCLVDSPEKCLPGAQELLPVVDAYLSVIIRGGQLLSDDVPRPCRICGKGYYRPSGQVPGRHKEIWVVPNGTLAAPGVYAGSWRQEGAHYFEPFICDVCKHVEMFLAG